MDDCYRIRVPTPFAVGRVNCYVLHGDGLTLVDPGPASEDSREALAEGLAEEGYGVGDVDRVLVTHPHMDHFGDAAAIAAESGAAVCAHTDAVGWLADPDAQFEREQALFKPFLVSMGLPERLSDTVISLPETYRDFRDPVTVDRELEAGDTVDAGLDLDVIHTPGHAPGSVCFLAAGEALFTGDHLLGHISPNPLLTTRPDDPDERTRSLPDYLDALETIRGVDAPVARPGHGDPVTDVDGRVAEIIEHHREREDRVANILAAEGPMTAYDVTQELFPDLPATELFPGMSETIGHLDLLEDEGRVAIEETDGVVTYDLAE